MKMLNLIESLERFGMNSHGCLRMQALCEALGDPQNKLQAIHIGGTNGKGSTCHMVASILEKQGYKVGVYISPALFHFNERITVNKTPLTTEEMDLYYPIFTDTLKKFENHPLGYPTEFEVVTALAFMYFVDQDVDYVVLEVGLGGRFDATNVITPILSSITNIDLDHTQILGDTIEEIAFEKAGIIKDQRPVILGTMSSTAIEVIINIANEKQSKVYHAEDIDFQLISDTTDGQELLYGNDRLTLSLLGKQQLENLKTTLQIIEVLKKLGVEISLGAIKGGLRNSKWPGRFEIANIDSKTIIFDVAHNEKSMKMLKCNLLKYFKEDTVTFVLGIFKDKDVESMIKILKELNHRIYITKPLGDRGMESEELKGLALKLGLKVVDSNNDLIDAFKSSLRDDSQTICVCGSFNTVGPIRNFLSTFQLSN